jgi:hypothetical protein
LGKIAQRQDRALLPGEGPSLLEALEEADLRKARSFGGAIIGALVVEREHGARYVVYLRAGWISGRSYRIVQTWRGKQGIRIWKSLDACFSFIRNFGFDGRITVYPIGHPDLERIAGISPEDSPGGLGDLGDDLVGDFEG